MSQGIYSPKLSEGFVLRQIYAWRLRNNFSVCCLYIFFLSENSFPGKIISFSKIISREKCNFNFNVIFFQLSQQPKMLHWISHILLDFFCIFFFSFFRWLFYLSFFILTTHLAQAPNPLLCLSLMLLYSLICINKILFISSFFNHWKISRVRSSLVKSQLKFYFDVKSLVVVVVVQLIQLKFSYEKEIVVFTKLMNYPEIVEKLCKGRSFF